MAVSHLLEDFGAYASGMPISLTDISLEEQKLESFEKGYQAGWDDSANSGAKGIQQISADLASNLQDIAFTYQEANNAVLQALKPLMTQMVNTVLPALAQQSLGQKVVEQLYSMAAEQAHQSIQLVTNPANVEALQNLLAGANNITADVVEDSTFAEGQVSIRCASHESEINLSSVLEDLSHKIDTYFDTNLKETA